MNHDENLFNAVMIAENPESAFLVEGNRLHAVEQHIAERKKEKSNPNLVLPLMRNALQALVKYTQDNVSPSSGEVIVSLQANEHDQLVEKIKHIFDHLPKHIRNDLSSLIHHKAFKK